MEQSKRIIVNTCAQYFRSAVSIVVSLYTVRLVLSALGSSDYGIYMLIGGVISMLGFITNALSVTTQRYLSFSQGTNDAYQTRKYFLNSLTIHASIALLLTFAIVFLQDTVVNDWMLLPSGRIEAAKSVYLLMTAVLLLGVLAAPYKAVLFSRENIVFLSCVEIFDCIVKLLLALRIADTRIDKLTFYVSVLAFIQFIDFVVVFAFSTRRFEECNLKHFARHIDKRYIFQILSFAGWTVYGTGVIVSRNQGIAILLNHFFGTVINAAYGIAYQVYGSIAFIATSLLNAINPRIMKAEGASDRGKMLTLALKECKFATSMLMVVTVPLLYELGNVLSFWLGNVPVHTVSFCALILIAFLCDQITYGLNTANQAMGRIRIYTLLMYTPKLFVLPIGYILLSNGNSPVAVMAAYVIIEIMVSFARVPYMKRAAGLHFSQYISEVLLPVGTLCVVLNIVSWGCIKLMDFHLRFFFTIPFVALLGIGVILFAVLNKDERNQVLCTLRRRGAAI